MEMYPNDLYVQPPKEMAFKQRVQFQMFVRQFAPEAFIEADVPFISQYLDLWEIMREVVCQIKEMDSGDYVVSNMYGIPTIANPIFQVYKNLSAELRVLANYLQVSPQSRYQPAILEAERTPVDGQSRKTIRMVNNFINEGKLLGPEVEAIRG